MRIFHKTRQQLSLLSAFHCDAELVSPLIHVEEKAGVLRRCPGNGVNMIDCHHIEVGEFIDDAGGLDLKSKPIAGQHPKIQQNFPVIPPDCFDVNPDSIESDVVGVRLYDILSVKPSKREGYYQLSDDVRIDLAVLTKPVFQNKKVVLFCTGIDVVIEKLWWLRQYINLFNDIASGKFYAVVGMNFSLFVGECPLGQLININKSLLFCQELGIRGVPVLPHVYAINDHQRRKWVDYLNAYPDIRTIVINTQLQKDLFSMGQVEKTVRTIVQNTDVTIILNGREPKSITQDPALSARVFTAKQSALKRMAFDGLLTRFGDTDLGLAQSS